jgi:hypothetical protein
MKQEIHISDVRTFKQCRRKWGWSSPLKRNLEPLIPYAPFFTGRAIHHCLEQYHGYGVPFDVSLNAWLTNERTEMEKIGSLWPAEESKLNEQVDLIRGILDHYSLWIQKLVGRWADSNLEFIALEHEFSVPLRNFVGRKSTKVYLAGRFDGLVKNRSDGTFWIWESKTTRSIAELVRSLANDEQCGAYIYAAEELFKVPVAGVLYNIMRKKVPTRPRVLQDGTLSKAKNIDTSPEVYLAAIREQHPGIGAEGIKTYYGDILQHLLEQDDKYFARIPIYRTEQEIHQLSLDLWATALEMTRGTTPLYPSPSWMNCGFCAFRAPCLAYNAGADVQFILKSEYRPRVAAKSWSQGADEWDTGNGNI